jgi:hypothetical protein
MNHLFSNRKKVTIALALITIIAVSSLIILQTNQTTQAALINPHSGAVGWWSFDEGTGTVAGDSSGNGNNGVVYGATWVPGKYGQALSFDRTAGTHLDINNYFTRVGSGDYMFSLWFYHSGADSVNELFAQRDNPDNTVNLIDAYHVSNGQVYFNVYNGGTAAHQTVRSSVSVSNNAWHFLCVGRSGSTMYMYIDGVDVTSSSSVTGNVPNIANPFRVGKSSGFHANGWTGYEDELQFYNRALSVNEVQQGFQNGPDFSSNILAKVPSGTTQVIATLSWQGTAGINATIVSPSQTYTESTQPVYQKTTYSTSDGTSSMLNIKRISVSVNALPSDQNWNVTLTFDNPIPYQITVEVQK